MCRHFFPLFLPRTYRRLAFARSNDKKNRKFNFTRGFPPDWLCIRICGRKEKTRQGLPQEASCIPILNFLSFLPRNLCDGTTSGSRVGTPISRNHLCNDSIRQRSWTELDLPVLGAPVVAPPDWESLITDWLTVSTLRLLNTNRSTSHAMQDVSS